MSSSGVQERDCPFKTLLSDTDKVRVDGSKTYHSRVNLFKHSYCSPHVSVYLLRLQRVSLLLGFIHPISNKISNVPLPIETPRMFSILDLVIG